MTLKTFLLSFVFVFALASASLAQAQTTPPDNGGQSGAAMLTPEQRIEKRLAHEQKALGLTDDQVAKLKAILQQNMAKIRADRQANQADRKQMMSDMKSMRDQMKDILTPDQLKKWKQERLQQIDRQEKRLQRQKQMLQK